MLKKYIARFGKVSYLKLLATHFGIVFEFNFIQKLLDSHSSQSVLFGVQSLQNGQTAEQEFFIGIAVRWNLVRLSDYFGLTWWCMQVCIVVDGWIAGRCTNIINAAVVLIFHAFIADIGGKSFVLRWIQSIFFQLLFIVFIHFDLMLIFTITVYAHNLLIQIVWLQFIGRFTIACDCFNVIIAFIFILSAKSFMKKGKNLKLFLFCFDEIS